MMSLSRIVAIGCAVAVYAFAGQFALGEGYRDALWQVVRTCVADYTLTGAAFPCLEVNISDSEERGYVILRPPVGKPDLILSPTRRIAGIEDPSLSTQQAPNYFEDAWNARSFLSDARQRPVGRDDVAVAVNSRLSRTQDQFHIHIACISREAKQMLRAIAPELSEDKWSRIRETIHGLNFRGRLVAQNTLAGVNPFRLAAEGLDDETESGTQMMILVAGAQLASGRGGFVVLASHNDPFRLSRQYSAEDFLDPSCSL
jgi:CDP-diacylglycerol pyrophosphatase